MTTPSRVLFLTGFMGAGKTSVGSELARRRGCAFFDLDAVIVQHAGQSVAQIFASSGEGGFRQLEAAALGELLQQVPEGAVIALGGGTLLHPQNVVRVRESGGVLVALDAPVEVLFARTRPAAGVRPLAADEQSFRELYAARRPLYLAADVVVDAAAGDVAAVAAQVESSVQALLGERREKQ